MRLTRREIVVGGALSLIFIERGIATDYNRTPHTFGCCLSDLDVEAVYPQGVDTRLFITGNEPMIAKSGDKYFDLALAQSLAKITATFDVLPGFAYYDDYDGKNAYATKRKRLARADGTVLMGMNFLKDIRSRIETAEVAIIGICAHEFGHILQYRHKLDAYLTAGQTTVKRVELQADYFAGYFAGRRKRERPDFPAAVIAMTQHNYGDIKFNEIGHHGTPEERGHAVVRGFEAAYHQNKSIGEAIQDSTSYARTL